MLQSNPPLDLKEQIARIDGMQAELQKFMWETLKLRQDMKLATPQTFFQGALAMAALIAAGVALAKFFKPLQAALFSRPRRKSFAISRAALCPGAPVTPPPGCVPDPHIYSPASGPR